MKITRTLSFLVAAGLAAAGCQEVGAQKSSDAIATDDTSANAVLSSGERVPDQHEQMDMDAFQFIDNVWGSTDHDRFLLGGNQRVREIVEDSITANPDNRIVMAHGISPGSVRVISMGADMVLGWQKNASATVKGQFVDLPLHQFGVQRVDFIDGGSWDREELRRRAGAASKKLQAEDLVGARLNIDGLIYNIPAPEAWKIGRLIYASGDHDRFQIEDRNSKSILEASTSQSPDNQLRLGVGLRPQDASVGCDDDGYEIDFVDGTRIELPLMRGSRKGVNYGVQKIIFEDGTVWTPDNLFALAQRKNPQHSPDWPLCDDRVGRVIDTAKNFALGEDSAGLQAFGGGDTILMRKAIINRGRYFISEEDVSGHAHNILQMDDRIKPSELSFKADGENLLIKVEGNTPGEITLERQLGRYAGREYGVQEIRFSDGTLWDNSELRAKLLHSGIIAPSSGPNGSARGFVIDTGTPVVQGSGQGDIVIYHPIVGNAEIAEKAESAGNDDGETFPHEPNILKMDPLIKPAMVKVFRGDGDDIVLFIGKVSSIELTDEMDPEAGIQLIEFADGTTWPKATIISLARQNPIKSTGVDIQRFGK